MTYTEESKKKIRAFLRAKKMSRGQILAQANLNRNTLHNVFSQEWNPKANTLITLEQIVDSWQG